MSGHTWLFLLHALIAAILVGVAAGADAEHVRPLVQYTLNGIAAGMGVTAVIHGLVLATGLDISL